MNAERRAAFVTSVGDLLASWHLPHATGRVYGLLLITERPVTLDEIAAELGLSKGAVSTAVRQLGSWGLARVIPQPGSRRL
ncbi:GbsR/MarR family transcriptional regulator, partial [Nonomuraea guangzhouensis]